MRPIHRTRHARRAGGGVLAAGALAVLAGCGSDVVRPPDCLDCRPVTMDLDQVLEVELGGDLSRGRPADPEAYEWVLTDSGTMQLDSQERVRRSEDPDEFVGGYSYTTVWRLTPGEPGRTVLEFQYVQSDTEEPVPGSEATSIEVIVSE
jgi:hypothetical protein